MIVAKDLLNVHTVHGIVVLNFTKTAIEKLANLAFEANKNVEDIGARRLHTIMEKLLEDLGFRCDFG